MNHPIDSNSFMRWRGLAAQAAAAFIVLAVAGCSSHAASDVAPPAPEVSVAQVLTRQVRQWDDFTGHVAAVQAVQLRARVSGYVEKVAYVEGQEVRKGDLLFVIDQRVYRAELARARADLARARSEAQLAKSQNARAQALATAKAISREESDTRSAAVAQADAAVAAAAAAVSTAELNLQFTEVRAPIDGRSGRALITVGNLAQADATVLTTLVSMDPVYVDFVGDEQTWLRYNELARKGERARLRNAVRIGLANESGYPHPGVVDFVDNRVDAETGTIHARAVLANPDHALTPGLFARVQLEGAAEAEALLVDDKAVLTDQDRKYVYVLGAGDKALRRDIVTGRLADGLRVVTSGLAPQDKVLVAGMQKVFAPGMAVQPKTIAMDAPVPAPERPVAMK